MGSLRGCILQKHGGVRIQEIGARIDGGPHIQKSRQQCFEERDGAHDQQREEIIESRHEKSEIDVIICSSNEMNHDDYKLFFSLFGSNVADCC